MSCETRYTRIFGQAHYELNVFLVLSAHYLELALDD